MGDRFRIGELLALVGTIGLVVSLTALDWFEPAFVMDDGANPAALATYPHGLVPLRADELGWFALALLLLAIVGAIVFLLRALTSRDAERPALQAPYAYVASGLAFLTLVWRLALFQPGPNPDVVSGKVLLSAQQIAQAHVEVSLLSGAWIGFASVTALMLGLWFSMHDERTGSRAARRRTDALLADVPARRIDASGRSPEPEAAVVADDAVGTDPSSPPSPASGGPA